MVRAPTALRPYLRFRRLTPKALSAARGVLDGDEDFRGRVSGSVTEDRIGAPAWRWLTRPDGWEVDWDRAAGEVASAEAAAQEASEVRRLQRELTSAKEAVRRADERVRRSDAATTRAAEALDLEQEQRARVDADLDTTRAEVERLRDERAVAVRSLKELERVHMATRAELRQEVDGRRAAEAALAERAAEGGESEADPSAADHRLVDAADGTASSAADRRLVDAADGIRRAAEAARALAVALAETAALLDEPLDEAGGDHGGVGDAADPSMGDELGPGSRSAAVGSSRPRPVTGRGRGRSNRRPVPVPAPLLEESPAAAGHLLRLPGAFVLVDGYNVSMTAWDGIPVAEQRDRLVDLLDELHARTGVTAVVVFDGVSGLGPQTTAAGRAVRVRFTESGTEADDVLIAMVDEVPVACPVVVVSSDARVREGAQRRGANVVGAAQFLAATGRS